jgi:predicted nucleic acid-binding protein
MSRIYWDSMLFIYLIEGNPQFGKKVLHLKDAIQRRGDHLCTSVFTLGEAMTGPQKREDRDGLRKIQEFFARQTVDILPFERKEAEQYSMIRATRRVSQADGIHLATAAVADVDLFVTNDERLRKLTVPGIRFFCDLDGRIA